MINYNQLLGNYNTTFFSVHLFDNDVSTYVHEYVHHIQNITTTYGLTYYTSRLIYLLHEFITKPNSYLYSSVHELWEKNKEIIKNIIKQVGTTNNLEYSNGKVENIVITTNVKYGIAIIDAVEIKLNINGEIHSVPFTVRMIKENMARLIQKHCFPESNVSKNVTYYLIEEVIRTYSPDFPVNTQTVVALCDIALMVDSPIHAFFDLLDYFRKFNSHEINAKFIYECIKSEKIICVVDNFNIMDLLDRQLNMCFQAIDAFFIGFDPQAHIKDWIKEIFYKGVEFRKKKFSFMCDIMNNSSAFESQIRFSNIIENLGFTIEIDRSGQFNIPKNMEYIDFTQLIALEELMMKIVEEKNGRLSPCILKNYCEAFVRNDITSVGYKTRNLKAVVENDLRGVDVQPVVNELCNHPMQRDMYTNLCPFTYVRRNIQRMNQ